eukprot:768310-Hanusia_phi.AAC.1
MLEGSPWSRVTLMVARAYPWAPSSPDKTAGKGKRTPTQQETQLNVSELEVELVRGPDLNAEVLGGRRKRPVLTRAQGIRAKLEFEELLKGESGDDGVREDGGSGGIGDGERDHDHDHEYDHDHNCNGSQESSPRELESLDDQTESAAAGQECGQECRSADACPQAPVTHGFTSEELKETAQEVVAKAQENLAAAASQ